MAGEYATTPTLSNIANVTFADGTVIFDQAVTIHNSDHVQFGSGTYWFKAGLSVVGSASVTFGTGTYIFGQSSNICSSYCLSVTNSGVLGPSAAGAAGALFYIENGPVEFYGNGSVTLVGESTNYNVALWDNAPASPNNDFTVTASGSADTLDGIYCPNNAVIINGGAPVNISYLDANSVQMSGSGALTVGG